MHTWGHPSFAGGLSEGPHQGNPKKEYVKINDSHLEPAGSENIKDEDYPHDCCHMCCDSLWRCFRPQLRAWYFQKAGNVGLAEFLYFILAVCNSCVLALGLLMSYGFEWWMLEKAVGGHVEKIGQTQWPEVNVDQVYAIWVLISLGFTIFLCVESNLEVLLNMCTHCLCCCNPRHSEPFRQRMSSSCCGCLMRVKEGAQKFTDTMESRFMFVRKYFAGLSLIVEPLLAILLDRDALITAPSESVTFGATMSHMDQVKAATEACNASAGTGTAGITQETCAIIGGCELCAIPSNTPIVAGGINSAGHVSKWAMNRQRWTSFTYAIIAVLYWCMHWVWKRKLAGEEINDALASDHHGRTFRWTTIGVAHAPVGDHPRPDQLEVVDQTYLERVPDGMAQSHAHNPTMSAMSNTSAGTRASARARRYQMAYTGPRARREFGQFGTVAILLGQYDSDQTDFHFILNEEPIGEEAKDLIYLKYPGLRFQQQHGQPDAMQSQGHHGHHGQSQGHHGTSPTATFMGGAQQGHAHAGTPPKGQHQSWFQNPMAH